MATQRKPAPRKKPARRAPACGWLKDRFGVSWQVAPLGVVKLFRDPKTKAAERAFAAMMGMKKIDIAALERARKG